MKATRFFGLVVAVTLLLTLSQTLAIDSATGLAARMAGTVNAYDAAGNESGQSQEVCESEGNVTAACDYCSEPNCIDYLICEDWDTGTPPDPWPIESGETWHGWTPAGYGNCPNSTCLGDISDEYAHSGDRSLLQWKQAGGKSTVDLEYSFPDTGVIHARFYLMIPSYNELHSMSGSHFLFINTASIAHCSLDFEHCGELNQSYPGSNPYIDCSSVLGAGNYVICSGTTESHSGDGSEYIANNQDIPVQDGGNRNYFIWEDHIGEWVCVEWKVDFVNDITSLWINGESHVTDYPLAYPYNNANSIIFSGFSQNLEPDMHYYIDDIVVSTSYIGPRTELPKLTLHGDPADETIHLTWTVNTTLPVTSTWQLAYDGPPGDQTSPISGISSPTRAYTLTGLTNYAWYTVTLNAMLDSTIFLTDTVKMMPTDIFVYLPLVLRDN